LPKFGFGVHRGSHSGKCATFLERVKKSHQGRYAASQHPGRWAAEQARRKPSFGNTGLANAAERDRFTIGEPIHGRPKY
jgi:hypothetical protein